MIDTQYMTVKITTPLGDEHEITTNGNSLEQCVEAIHLYLDTMPMGTRVYFIDCSNEKENSYEVAG